MLVVFSGLPGTGKTTIGKLLAGKRLGTYLRVDEIEHALSHAAGLGHDIGPAGYIVAFAIAASNLKLGNFVVADCVNPVPESRQGWRNVARGAAARLVEVEVVCSDEREHEHRVMTRTTDIEGFIPPSWSSVKAHNYVPWISPRLVVDTALLSPEAALAEVEAAIDTISAV